LLTIRAAARNALKDPVGGLADAELAVKLAPTNEDAISVLAGLYNSAGRGDEAGALLESSLAKLPESTGLRQVLVQYYAAHGRNDKTEALLKDLIRLQPQEKAYRLALARFYSSSNRLDDAERVLHETIAVLPGDSSLRLALVEFLAARRGRETAERELVSMTSARPDDYELQLAIGAFYEQGEQIDKAEPLYRKIITAQGKKPAALAARDRIAAMYVRRNDIVGARKLLAEVLEANPRDSEALVMRSQLALAEGDAKSAIVDLRAVVRDQPNSVPLLRQLARAYIANGDQQLGEDMLHQAIDSSATDTMARADLAQYYLERGRPNQARTLADELANRDPKNVEFRVLQFRATAASKDYVAAAAIAAALRTDHQELQDGWYLGGLVAEAQDRPDEALRGYDRALEINGRLKDPLEAEVKLLMRQKKSEAALERISRIVVKFPDDAYPVNMRGELLLGMKRTGEAEDAFQAAARLAPEWWVPFRNLAYVKIARNDAPGAVKILQDSASRLGQPESLVGELAVLLQRLGRNDDAIAAYEALLGQHPQSDFGANNLAMLLVSARSEPASFNRARELVSRLGASSNPSYLDTSGWVLFRHGEAAAAVPVLEKAVTLAPDAAVIRYHLALAQYGSGQKQTALANLQRALDTNQRFDGVDAARNTLAEWKKSG
jgi:tetratricopeptide (TPR) repeat protein